VVGIDVLTEQRDLARAAGDQALGLGDDFGDRARLLGAAGIGHHAEGAELVAALLDREEGRDTLGRCRLGQVVELGFDRKLDVEHPARALLAGRAGDQLRQTVVGLGAEHQIDLGRAAQDLRALRLGHATGHRNGHAPAGLGVGPLERAQPAELGIDLFGSLFPDMAGVEDHHIGALGPLGGDVAERRQHVGHARGIVDVHLTAIGLYVQLLGQGRLTLSYPIRSPGGAVRFSSDA
jgi:hypothetical protein